MEKWNFPFLLKYEYVEEFLPFQGNDIGRGNKIRYLDFFDDIANQETRPLV